MRYIHVFGEMRTGSNYVMHSVKANVVDAEVLPNTREKVGWKHALPDMKKYKAWNKAHGPIDSIVTIKDPFGWAWSMITGTNRRKCMKNHYFKESPYTRGIVTQATVLKNCPELYVAMAKRWNQFYKGFVPYLDREDFQLIRYEDILRKPKKTIRAFLDNANLKMKPDFKRIGKYISPGSVEERKKAFSRKHFYLERAYMDSLPKGLYEIFCKNIDWEIMNSFGYREER